MHISALLKPKTLKKASAFAMTKALYVKLLGLDCASNLIFKNVIHIQFRWLLP